MFRFASLFITYAYAATKTLNFNYPLYGNLYDATLFGCTQAGGNTVQVGFAGTLRKQWKHHSAPGNSDIDSFDVRIIARGGNGNHQNDEIAEELLDAVSLDGSPLEFEKAPSRGGCTGNPYIFVDLNGDDKATKIGRCSELRKEPIDLTTLDSELSKEGNVGLSFSMDCTNKGDTVSLGNLVVHANLDMVAKVRCESKNSKFVSTVQELDLGDVQVVDSDIIARWQKQPSLSGVTGNPELYVQIRRHGEDEGWTISKEVSLGKCIQGGGRSNKGAQIAAGAVGLVGLIGVIGFAIRRSNKQGISPFDQEENVDAFDTDDRVPVPELEVEA